LEEITRVVLQRATTEHDLATMLFRVCGSSGTLQAI
jgi:hypothetical protein